MQTCVGGEACGRTGCGGEVCGRTDGRRGDERSSLYFLRILSIVRVRINGGGRDRIGASKKKKIYFASFFRKVSGGSRSRSQTQGANDPMAGTASEISYLQVSFFTSY